MRTPRLVTSRRPRVRLWNGSRLIRIRLWVAMLGLAVLPMLGVLLISNALRPVPDGTTAERRAWETAAAAAQLTAVVGDLETRLLGVAADPRLPLLVDGLDGADERQVAAEALASLRAGDDQLVLGACVTRVSDPAGVPLPAVAGSTETETTARVDAMPVGARCLCVHAPDDRGPGSAPRRRAAGHPLGG